MNKTEALLLAARYGLEWEVEHFANINMQNGETEEEAYLGALIDWDIE